MPIRKHEDWGRPGSLPDGAPVASTDAEAREIVERARRSDEALPAIGLAGGDLCRTLGGRGRLATVVEVDVGAVLLDGRLHWFVAHLVGHRRLWRGHSYVAMNAAWVGSWYLGPRAHPGDGLLDISEGKLSLADRVKAKRRVTSGEHLPHPDIKMRRVAAQQVNFRPALPVALDGVPMGRVANLSVRLEPGALTVVV